MATVRPSTVPVTPLPGERLEIARPRRASGPAPRPPSTIAAASGCSLAALEARGEPEELGFVIPAGAATTETSRGFPSVSVPVLSTTSVSTFSRTSSASAFLMSTPAVAPRPVPTMIDIGVASPSAQGQAMISTATALTSA